jgi:hypothetical protein
MEQNGAECNGMEAAAAVGCRALAFPNWSSDDQAIIWQARSVGQRGTLSGKEGREKEVGRRVQGRQVQDTTA